MDDDAMQQALDIGDFEIERRLDAFARARLTPDPAAVARTRARVMREARLQFEAARIAAHVVPAVTLATHRPIVRRIAMPLLAASLWIGVAVGTVAASQAGGALYPTRLWIETAALPAAAAERTSAELGRLDARLSDAMGAAARGDASAVAAALAAYREIADETVTGSTGDEDLETLVGAALDRHVAVLAAVSQSLQEQGNSTAADAVETAILRAIEHNEAVVANLAENDRGHGTDGAATSGGAGGAAGNGGGSNANGGNAGSAGGAGASGGNGQTGNGQTGTGGSTGAGGAGGSGQTGNGQTGTGGSTGAGGAGGSGQTGNGQTGTGGAKPSKPPRPSTAPDDQQDENGSARNPSSDPSE